MAPSAARKCRKKVSNQPKCEDMESEIWKDFPEDLFEAVNARLPVATFFKFRTVCQKWNSFPSSDSFAQQQQRGISPWFYTITDEETNSGAMYDPRSKKWHPPPPKLSLSLPVESIVLPVASAGGLVCFLDICEQNFYVCNPLTASFRQLPPISKPSEVLSRGAVGMVAFGSLTYRILWIGRDGEHAVYDSVTDSWSNNMTCSDIKLPLSLIVSSPAISVENTVHFMVSDPEGIRLVSYDMVSATWSQLTIPAPVILCHEHVLAECKGRIVLVGLLAKNAALCVVVWELVVLGSTRLWKEIDRMPNLWCLEFYGKNIRITCLGNKDMLMLSLNWGNLNRLVTYDLVNREWHKVPRCSVACGRKRPWIVCGIGFRPSPTAIA